MPLSPPVRIIEGIAEPDLMEMLKPKGKAKRKSPVDNSWRKRYSDAKLAHDTKENSAFFRAGGFVKPTYPDVRTSNGLMRMIEDIINWDGYRCTRINVSGRKIGKKWIKAATRKGSADLSSTIKGRSVMWEVKIGSDRPREEQLKEQAKELAAGGEYFFVKTPAEFFEKYDYLLSL